MVWSKKMRGPTKYASTIPCCVGLLSSFLMLANAADLHVKVAPGFNATDIQHLGVVTPLFTCIG